MHIPTDGITHTMDFVIPVEMWKIQTENVSTKWFSPENANRG